MSEMDEVFNKFCDVATWTREPGCGVQMYMSSTEFAKLKDHPLLRDWLKRRELSLSYDSAFGYVTVFVPSFRSPGSIVEW